MREANEEAVAYLSQAKTGKISGHSYIPLRKDTPQIIIDTMAQVGEKVENNSLVMQVRKAQQAMSEQKDQHRAGRYGGYAAQKMLLPSSHAPQVITLKGNKKEIKVTM